MKPGRHHAATIAPATVPSISDQRRDAITDIRTLCDHLEAMPPRSHWIEQLRDGDMLTVTEAAAIAGCVKNTIHRWCEDAEQRAPPFLNLSIVRAGTRFVSRARLFCWIEQEDGLHARRQAETRALKIDANVAGITISAPE